MTPRTLFTLEEARALVPFLRPRLRRMRETWRRLTRFRAEAESLEGRTQLGGTTFAGANEYLGVIMELESRLSYFRRKGVDIKDISSGLVDFPSMRGGRVVSLCWHMGEDTVSHWHEVHAGFAGRRELDDPAERKG